MAIRMGINGLGRIGRLVLRLAQQKPEIEVVHINDPMDRTTMHYLLKYDSVHGKFNGSLSNENGFLWIDGHRVVVTHEPSPETIDWRKTGAEIVIDSSGHFLTRESLEPHLRGGARKVILSCPPSDNSIERTVVIGVNHNDIRSSDRIISNASCTTQCAAIMLKVLDDAFEIESAFMNTVHPFTNNQSLVDGIHSDERRSRAVGVNIIPTTSTAVRAVGLVMPHLRQRFDGFATRVPVPCGSYVELTSQLHSDVNPQRIRDAFLQASSHDLKGLLEYSLEPLVSTDIINNSHSAIFDALSTKVIGSRLVQTLGWYDNEWGYSNRIIDLVRRIA